LEGKLLLIAAGKPLIVHTIERVIAAGNIDRVLVATDDTKIFDAVTASGCEAVMTAATHQSGSDRIAEAAESLAEGAIVVNVQGDEPLISPRTIESAVQAMIGTPDADIVTVCEKIHSVEDVLSADVVKVVLDNDGFALYFSRSPVPFPRDAVKTHGSLQLALETEPNLVDGFRKHTGLYVYRREFLLKYTKMPRTRGEKLEMLEQLRALENGAKIKVIESDESSIGVDTAEDYARVRAILER
jgi:3-deoxy-manno-octulosonate cytidylyltransferase (CMP-KDO synthetase)